jgi:hypothetical protein
MRIFNVFTGLACFAFLYLLVYAWLQSIPESRGIINTHHSGDWLTAFALLALGGYGAGGAIRR